jgi:polysaccharide biosynthesis transport protein
VTSLCTAGAWELASHQQPATFKTVASVIVQGTVQPGTASLVPDMATAAAIATSRPVLLLPARSFGVTTGELAKDLSVSNPANTDILQIGCSMPTATAARRCTDAVTASYADYRNELWLPREIRAWDPVNVSILQPARQPAVQPSGRFLVLLALGAILGLALGIGTASLDNRLSSG